MSRVYGESFIVNEMMDGAIFTSFLTVFQVTSGRCAGNNERLNAMELCLRLGRFRRLDAGLEPVNARSRGKLNPLRYPGSFHSRNPHVGETFFVQPVHGFFVLSFQTLESV